MRLLARLVCGHTCLCTRLQVGSSECCENVTLRDGISHGRYSHPRTDPFQNKSRLTVFYPVIFRIGFPTDAPYLDFCWKKENKRKREKMQKIMTQHPVGARLQCRTLVALFHIFFSSFFFFCFFPPLRHHLLTPKVASVEVKKGSVAFFFLLFFLSYLLSFLSAGVNRRARAKVVVVARRCQNLERSARERE